MNGTVVRVYSLAKDGDKKLSDNFRVREFACKDGTDTIFISDGLVAVLQQVRSHFKKRVFINSAYRTDKHNRACGGSKYSQHLYGLAADIVVEGVSPKEVASYVRKIMPKSGGVGIYSSFIHIDDRKERIDWVG